MPTGIWVLFLVAISGAIVFTALAFRRKSIASPGRGQTALLIAWLVVLTAVVLLGLLWVLGLLLYIRSF